MPWNYPFWQVMRFALPAILVGNGCVLKHAPNVFGCALRLEDLFLEAGFPDHLFKSLLIDHKQVPQVLQHPAVQGLSLTGSAKAGAQVAAMAAGNLKRQVLELGGSDPFIVLEDADIEHAAKVAVKSRMQNAGQSCIAAKRLIVAQAVAAEFTELVRQEIEQLIVGDPRVPEVQLGPMARPDLADALHSQISDSVLEGADLVMGGKREGTIYMPSLMVNIKPTMRVWQEETFGPVAVIMQAKNEEKAIEIANHTRYGLGASLWTSDYKKAAELVPRLNSGMVFVNSMVKSDPAMPFGGVKHSGYGRELYSQGLHEFANQQTVFFA
jgi:succinate-semialdehyde dehydrogenase/glutarate-semialdehyde dehydrogenase